MGVPFEELQRLGIKLFAADGAAVAPREVVPIFHRWIQTSAVDGQMLIDVADYAHVPDGPGIVLVAHEGNLSLQFAHGRTALTYMRKQPLDGGLDDRLRAIARTAVTACRLLEDDPAIGSRLHFRGDELVVLCNDRLIAPNTAAAREALQPAVERWLGSVYGSAACRVSGETDERERLQVRAAATQSLTLRQLAERLA
jgi:hypothetical protein